MCPRNSCVSHLTLIVYIDLGLLLSSPVFPHLPYSLHQIQIQIQKALLLHMQYMYEHIEIHM